MPGTALDNLTVLVESQGPAWATSAEMMVNDAVRHNYTIARIVSHKNIRDVVRGGDKIADRIFLTADPRLERYNPNQTLTGQLTNPGVNFEVPWAFAAASCSYTEQHLGLNFESMGKAYRTQKYKDVLRQLHMELHTGIHESLELEQWAPPDFTNMESGSPSGPRQPLSFPVLVNEFPNGLPVGLGQTSWTTKQQINPALAANTRWRNQVRNYTYTSTPTDGAWPGTLSLLTAFGSMFRRLKLAELPDHKQFSNKHTMSHVVWTQEQGLINYEFALLVNQDHFRGMGSRSGSDPAYPSATYLGVPVEWIQALDTAEIYPTGTASTTAAATAWSTWDDTLGGPITDVMTNPDGSSYVAGYAGPRYYFMNLNFVHWAVHQDKYLRPTPVITPDGKPFSRIQYWDLWNNLFASSLYRQGLLTPSADTTNATA